MEDIAHGASLVLVQKRVAAEAFSNACALVQIQHLQMAGNLVLATLLKLEPAVQGAVQVLKLIPDSLLESYMYYILELTVWLSPCLSLGVGAVGAL